jgi:hypothetical protein
MRAVRHTIGEGVGGAGERLLLASQQGRTGGDHAVERPKPFQRLEVTGFHLGDQPTGRQQVVLKAASTGSPAARVPMASTRLAPNASSR